MFQMGSYTHGDVQLTVVITVLGLYSSMTTKAGLVVGAANQAVVTQHPSGLTRPYLCPGHSCYHHGCIDTMIVTTQFSDSIKV